jgi:hypothetical protein
MGLSASLGTAAVGYRRLRSTWSHAKAAAIMSAVAAPQIAMYGQKPYAANAASRPLLTTKMTPNKAPMQTMTRAAHPAGIVWALKLAQWRPECK